MRPGEHDTVTSATAPEATRGTGAVWRVLAGATVNTVIGAALALLMLRDDEITWAGLAYLCWIVLVPFAALAATVLLRTRSLATGVLIGHPLALGVQVTVAATRSS